MKKIPLIYWTILNLLLICIMYLIKSKSLCSCFIMGAFTVLLYKYSKDNHISTNKINALYYFIYCSTLSAAIIVLEFLATYLKTYVFRYINYVIVVALSFCGIKLLYYVGKELDIKIAKRKAKKTFEQSPNINHSCKSIKNKFK